MFSDRLHTRSFT